MIYLFRCQGFTCFGVKDFMWIQTNKVLLFYKYFSLVWPDQCDHQCFDSPKHSILRTSWKENVWPFKFYFYVNSCQKGIKISSYILIHFSPNGEIPPILVALVTTNAGLKQLSWKYGNFYAVGQHSLQGCQMVCFQTKNPNLGKFWRVFQWKSLVYFMII
jgi:hypothetical protein